MGFLLGRGRPDRMLRPNRRVLPTRSLERARPGGLFLAGKTLAFERSRQMQIRTRMCLSVDGCVTTPDGWPVQLADPAFVAGESYGFPEFQESCDAALMGRTTFEPALGADRWPWPDLDVFVLASRRPSGTPDEVVIDGDPACWSGSGKGTGGGTFTSWAALARPRPSARSGRSTSWA